MLDTLWIHNTCGKHGSLIGLELQLVSINPHSYPQSSFSDAEVPENNVENVVNVDAPNEAAQGPRGQTQFLGEKIFTRVSGSGP